MYVIGQVESNHNWAAVNRSDPITLGMMQWYGQRAANLISHCAESDPDGYETFKSSCPTLCAAVEAGHDWDWWTSYYVNDAEATAWGTWAERDGNHEGQQTQWFDDYEGYVSTLTGWGLSEDRPQTLIYAMSMYHQSPAQAGKVIGSCGGTATLANMHATCLNDSILGQYRNRYNTVYELLSSWDGESAPPDFGQVDGITSGGNSPSISQPQSYFSSVELRNGLIFVHGIEGYPNGLMCYRSGPNYWIPCINAEGEENPGGNTGGGSATGTEAQMQIRQWMLDHLQAFAYSQGAGRLSPETSGYTDCSGLCWYAYQKITGVNVGTWTGDMLNYGTVVAQGSGSVALPIDEMQVADLVLVMHRSYNSTYDHVEMYIGDNQLCGHGGPGAGPTVKNDAQAYCATQYYWMVRRYL